MPHDGVKDLSRAAEALAATLPPRLAPLARVAYDYRWSWTPGGAELFRSIHPERWERTEENPVRLLLEAGRAALDRAAADDALVARAEALAAAVAFAPAPAAPVAFFCAEYGLHRSLPIYSGGLGALTGDLVKQASDQALPLVAVGLLYRQGYFHQRLDATGWQHEFWTEVNPERLPAALVTGADGEPIVFGLPFDGREVQVQIWRVDAGNVPLYLLDCARPDNAMVNRWITARLYVGDRPTRLLQYLVLGVGGVRALRAMGIEPRTVHLNEGHAAFAPLELAREHVAAGASFEDAVAAARARTVFTTHTPVLAGNESYGDDEIAGLLAGLRLAPDALLALGRGVGNGFGLTPLALHVSRHANGVSRRHGEVARRMWHPLFPDRAVEDVPIDHVTNGVHIATWMAPPLRALLDRHLGAGWEARAAQPATWAGIADIPDAELWAVRGVLRATLVGFARERSVHDRLARGDARDYVEAAARTFDPDVLTIGFARRLATYKRASLLTRDPARALALLDGLRPVQIVIAGKAHPNDDEAKRIVQLQLFPLRSHPEVGARVAYLEDYDLAIATQLVRSCDVWVNLPRPPLEASGTSGMKAAMNGGLNLSVLDGWWAEAADGTNGWSIDGREDPDTEAQDARDAATLFQLLENEVVPEFYDRGPDGVPARWMARVKRSLMTLGPRFSAARMLEEYRGRIY